MAVLNFVAAFILLLLSCSSGRNAQYGFVKFSVSSSFFFSYYKGSRYLNIDAAPDSGKITIHEVSQRKILSGTAKFSETIYPISEGYYSRPDWTLSEKQILNISQPNSANCRENPVYHNIAKREFLERNLPVETFKLSNCIKLDLNGDKIDEVLYIAQNYDNPTNESFKNRISAKRNHESFQLMAGLRYINFKSGKVKERILNRFEISNLYYDSTGFEPHYAESVDIHYFRNPLGKGTVLLYRPVFEPKAAGASCRSWIVSFAAGQFHQAECWHFGTE